MTDLKARDCPFMLTFLNFFDFRPIYLKVSAIMVEDLNLRYKLYRIIRKIGHWIFINLSLKSLLYWDVQFIDLWTINQ
jgi:hypothetical protein